MPRLIRTLSLLLTLSLFLASCGQQTMDGGQPTTSDSPTADYLTPNDPTLTPPAHPKHLLLPPPF